MKKIISAVMILLAVLGMTACGESGIEPISLSVSEHYEEICAEDGFVLVEVSADTISVSGGGEGAAGRINAAFYQSCIQPGSATIDELVEYMEQYRGELELEMSSCYSRDVHAGRSDGDIFVLIYEQDHYFSGAVTNIYEKHAMCFDPATGKQLSLSGLGINGADPTDRIVELLVQEFLSTEEAAGYWTEADAAEAIGGMVTADLWYLDDDGLVLNSNK